MTVRQKKKQVTKKMRALKPLNEQEQIWCKKYYSNGSAKLSWYKINLAFINAKEGIYDFCNRLAKVIIPIAREMQQKLEEQEELNNEHKEVNE